MIISSIISRFSSVFLVVVNRATIVIRIKEANKKNTHKILSGSIVCLHSWEHWLEFFTITK